MKTTTGKYAAGVCLGVAVLWAVFSQGEAAMKESRGGAAVARPSVDVNVPVETQKAVFALG